MTTTIVAGLGRCGSSLTMQLLHAGGLRCLGAAPAFEDMRTSQQAILPSLIESMAGGALKVLDPQRNRIPRECRCRVIWLDRDPVHQARSQAKLMEQVLGLPVSRQTRRAIASALERDTRKAFAALNPAWPLMRISFEQLLAAPDLTYQKIAAFVPGLRLDLEVDRVVRMRGPECRPDLEIELSLLRQAEAVA